MLIKAGGESLSVYAAPTAPFLTDAPRERKKKEEVCLRFFRAGI